MKQDWKTSRRPERARQPFKRIERRLAKTRSLSTTSTISRRMGTVRQRGTSPELAVRRIVSQLGIRYTLRNRDLPGSPDLANRTKRFAIFVHGCFWHRHRRCALTTTPRSNRSFWQAKFVRNVERDRASIRALRARNFRAVVIWGCEVARDSLVLKRIRPLGCR